MATIEEAKKLFKEAMNEVLNERQQAADDKAAKEAEEAAKNPPPKKGFLDTLFSA